MNEVYENIANMEEKQNDEIQLKVHDYCEGRRQAMSVFIAEKKLVSEEEDGIDCLMGFLENEMKQPWIMLVGAERRCGHRASGTSRTCGSAASRAASSTQAAATMARRARCAAAMVCGDGSAPNHICQSSLG